MPPQSPTLSASPVREQGQLVLGLDRDSQYYATLTPDRDPKAAEAKGRVIIGLGLGAGRELMVTSLRREVALASQLRDGLTPAAQALIDEVMAKPQDEATIFGVQFRTGEAATGQVVDTSVYDHRAVQATLTKIEAELAGTALGRRAEPLVIGGAEQRVEAAKTVAAMDEMQALQGELEASRSPEAMDAVAADAPALDAMTAEGDETVLGAWIRQLTILQVDTMRLDLASKDPADDANPDVLSFRQVAQEMVDSVRALHAAEMEAKGLTPKAASHQPTPPRQKPGG